LSDLQSYLKAQIDEEKFFGEDKIFEIKNLENVFADGTIEKKPDIPPGEVDSKSDVPNKQWTKPGKIAVVIRAIKEGNLTKVAEEIEKPESTTKE